MAYCQNECITQGLSCPCGRGTEPICNTARARARYSCAACGGQAAGCLAEGSQPACIHVVDVALSKTVYPTCVLRGGRVLYTIAIHNCSTLPITGVVVTDSTLARWFRIGLIRVNGTVVSGNPETGIPIPGIGAGGTAVVSIEATLLEGAPALIRNTARAAYTFTTACGGSETAEAVSNQAELRVMEPGLTVVKTAGRCFVTPAEPVVTYTVEVTNTGNCELSDVVVTDALPDRLAYVHGTTRINEGAPVDRDPARGVNLGSLDPRESATLKFDAELVCKDETGCALLLENPKVFSTD